MARTMTDHFPGPIHSDQADSAEARRRNLKNRFRAVSRNIDRKGGFGGGFAGGMGFSPFEIAIGVAGVLFVLWAAGHLLGVM